MNNLTKKTKINCKENISNNIKINFHGNKIYSIKNRIEYNSANINYIK